jgi:hypothetical protein
MGKDADGYIHTRQHFTHDVGGGMNGLVKTLDGIKLVGNALTFILYKSYFGRDLLNDIVGFAKKSADAATVKKFNSLNIKSVEDVTGLSEEEQDEILAAVGDYKFDSEFVLNFIAALIATAKYPLKPDVIDVILEIPPHWIADKTVITELMEFLALFITNKKKTASAGGGGL